jgi:hypothetical protein
MALQFHHGVVQWLTSDALNSTKVITGLGFTPKALRFYWVGIQSNSPTNAASQALNERRGIGFAVSSTSRRSVGTFNQDAAASANCGSVASDNCVVITVDGSGVVDGRLDINSFDSDGFTLIVDDVTPANISVFYEAWGGDDITVAEVGNIAEPAATGNQTYTVNGFTSDGRNQVLMFANVQSTAALNSGQAQDSGLGVGFASSTNLVNNITICGNSDDASATMDTDGYVITGECLSQIIIAGGNTSARARLQSWGTNSFTLNWLQRATTNRRYIYLAIKGGSWEANGSTINASVLSSTSTTVTLPFSPVGITSFTRNAGVNTPGNTFAQDIMAWGTAKSTTSRNSVGCFDENGTANVEINLTVAYDSLLELPSGTGTSSVTIDVNNFRLNDIQFIVDVAGGSSVAFIGYLTFGSTRIPRTTSIGHPFII